jgi:hypothetical protein
MVWHAQVCVPCHLWMAPASVCVKICSSEYGSIKNGNGNIMGQSGGEYEWGLNCMHVNLFVAVAFGTNC